MNKNKIFRGLRWIFLTLIAGVIGFFLNPVLTKFFTDPIIVTPSEVNVYASTEKTEKRQETLFAIVNRREKSFFNVWLKLIPSKTSYQQKWIVEIAPRVIDLNYCEDLGKMYRCSDHMVIEGVDANGTECIWLWMYSLMPNVSRHYTLTSGFALSTTQSDPKVKVQLKIVGEPLTEAQPLGRESSESEEYYWTASVFKTPENIQRAQTKPLFVRKKKALPCRRTPKKAQ